MTDMNKINKTASLLSISLLFTACTFKDVKVQKQTDGLLNCQKLTTQIADLMDINDDINEETGLEKSSLTIWIMWPPVGLYNQYNAFNARGKIDDRLEHLLRLKLKNRCRTTIAERYYLNTKGRFSDILNIF